MDITELSVQEAIAVAYAGVPATMWEFRDPDKVADVPLKRLMSARLRKYCPLCNQANTLVDIVPTQENNYCRFRCRSCDHLCKVPKALLPTGPNPSSSRVSRIDPNQRVAQAMEASEVMNAVESLPTELRLWVLWVYTDPEQAQRDTLEGKLLAVLVCHLDKLESKNLQGLKAGSDAIRIISMAMNSYRQERRCKRALYKSKDYAKAIGVDRAQFSGTRLWARVLRQINIAMDEFNVAALKPVGQVLIELEHGDDVFDGMEEVDLD